MNPYDLQVLSNHFTQLVKELRDYSPQETISKLASLLVRQEYHPNTPRLETLIHLAVIHCEGKNHPKRKDLVRWLNEYLGGRFALIEDPVEDVFVSNICLKSGNARLFEGVWESSDFYTQQLLDLTTALPKDTRTQAYWASIEALLRLSESIAERVNVERYTLSTGHPKGEIDLPSEKQLNWQKSWVIFEKHDLDRLGISLTDLSPFIIEFQQRRQIIMQSIGFTDLERYPIITDKNKLIVALPSSISLSIRRFIIEWFSNTGQLASLNKNLSKLEVGQVLFEALPRFDAEPYHPEKGQIPHSSYFLSTMATFDTGKYAHILVIPDTLDEQAEFTGYREASDTFRKTIEDHTVKISEEYSKKENYTGGISLLILGGIGQGKWIGLEKVPIENHWHLVAISLADFIHLSWEEDISLLEIWKIEEQKQYLEKHGIEFSNINGIINLYGYWKESRNSLCPDEYPFMSTSGELGLMTDFVTKIRKELRVGYDEHSVAFDEGTFYRMRRESLNGLFKENKMLPAYVSHEFIQTQKLYGVVETNRPWWILIEQSDIPAQYKSLTYKIWEAVFRWMTKAAPIIDHAIQNKSTTPIKIIILLKDVTQWGEINREILLEEPQKAPLLSVESNTITLCVEKRFIRNFFQPENEAEKNLILSILMGVQKSEGKKIDIEALIKVIFPDNDARFLHMFEAKSYSDHIKGMELEKYRFIKKEDESNSRLGLSWLVKEPMQNGETIVGVEQCVSFLNSLPVPVWHRMKERLKEIDFYSLSMKALDNIIALDIDQINWKRTSKANLALYNDKQDVIQAAWERDSQRNAASLASRLLIEMAICTSPHGRGRSISQSDFDSLLADAILIAHIGQYSDAIKDGYMAAQVQIMPSGNIHIQTEFYDQVVIPRSEHYFSGQFKQSATYYEQYYAQKQQAKKTCEELLGVQFTDAFTAEFGFDMNSISKFITSIEDYGLKLNQPYFQISRNDLVQLISSEQNIDEAEISAILEAFSLPIRVSWQENPEGYKGKDWWPWKFRRRLSLISRPIITLKGSQTVNLLIAPGFVWHGIRYIISGSHEGAFPNDFFISKEMKAWVGKANNERGHEFNEEVSNRLQQLGLCIELEATIQKITGKPQSKDLGDIDVLAWDKKKSKIYILECKNLHFAKTLGEIAEQLNRFRGVIDKKGKPDELAKHLRRVQWAESNTETLSKYTGLPFERSSIEHFIVFSNQVPMKYFDNLPIEKDRILEISQLGQIF
jgi:hypothetical protein